MYQAEEETGTMKLTEFCSRVLRRPELSYIVIEKRRLTVVYALQK